MQTFTISNKRTAEYIGSVSAKSLECLEASIHLGTDSDGKKVPIQYKRELHNASSEITNSEELYTYLYDTYTPTLKTPKYIQDNAIIQIQADDEKWTNRNKLINGPKNLSAYKTPTITWVPTENAVIGVSNDAYLDAYLIKSDGNNVTLTNIIFHNFNDPSLNIIDVYGGDLTINTCTFDKNHGVGSIIKVAGNSAVSINNSIFDSNITTLPGGAIHHDTSKNLSITGCTFINNRSAPGVNTKQCFDACCCTQTHGGGAIYTRANTIIFNGDNSFNENTTDTSGLVCDPSSVTPPVYTGGGAIFIDSDATTINIDSGTTYFNINTAIDNSNLGIDAGQSHGGAIYSKNHLTISGDSSASIIFEGNSATTGGGIYGAGIKMDISAIFLGNYTDTTTGTFFSWPDHNMNGGAYASNDSDIDISGATFRYNSSVAHGGAIYVGSGTDMSDTIFKSTDFTGNHSGTNGGAIYFEHYADISLGLDNVEFSGNYAKSNGGAVAIVDACGKMASIGAHSATFVNNGQNTVDGSWATLNGGAIWSGAELTLLGDFSFNTNIASQYGGAIYSKNKLKLHPTTQHMQFINNSALQGWAIYSSDNIDLGNTPPKRIQGEPYHSPNGTITFISLNRLRGPDNTIKEIDGYDPTGYTIWSNGTVDLYIPELTMIIGTGIYCREYRPNHIYARKNWALMRAEDNPITEMNICPSCNIMPPILGQHLCDLTTPILCEGHCTYESKKYCGKDCPWCARPYDGIPCIKGDSTCTCQPPPTPAPPPPPAPMCTHTYICDDNDGCKNIGACPVCIAGHCQPTTL